uniref:DUF4291 domain-containing protein n=1 Tax=uncultured Armatimonadetes bacterium TaxID=157466 RepID=A0A6J4IY31_9BACT|nr:hypothetical protein AVDCRST_MAG63-2541 [uncultured Armatimonadetes bacterium]
MSDEPSTRRIYAWHDDRSVYVYQAFRPSIVQAAVAKGTFGSGFTLDRMTWIKPSFGWMLHRSGYATRHRQEAVARVHLSHAGFRAILEQAVPTLYDERLFASERDWSTALDRSDVRYQWDPDRDLHDRKLARRAIQLGIRGETVRRYVEEWVLGVEDVTELALAVGAAVKGRGGTLPDVPEETEYAIEPDLLHVLGYDAPVSDDA